MHMHHCVGASFVQVMSCRQFGINALHDPVWITSVPPETSLSEIWIKIHFYCKNAFENVVWKMSTISFSLQCIPDTIPIEPHSCSVMMFAYVLYLVSWKEFDAALNNIRNRRRWQVCFTPLFKSFVNTNNSCICWDNNRDIIPLPSQINDNSSRPSDAYMRQ